MDNIVADDQQAYHSIFLNDPDVRVVGTSHLPLYRLSLLLTSTYSTTNNSLPGNFAVLPLRTRTRGPAYTLPALPAGVADLDVDPDSESYDVLDEVLTLFRANTFFRNFEIRGPADRLLIYGILFVSDCLTRIKPTMGSRDAEKVGKAV